MTMATCEELKAQQELYLATNVTCSDRWYNILRKYSFATEGVGLFVVAVVGVMSNLLSIAALCQRTMKSQITALLITLAIFDIVFLLSTFPVFTVASVNEFVEYLNECYYSQQQNATTIQLMSTGVQDLYYFCLPFLYGLTHVSKVGSVFTTLAVSLERYFAVCKPLWIRIRRCHPALYIILVTVFAFAFNIPKFLEFEALEDQHGHVYISPTSLRTDRNYVVYYNFWTKTLLTELFPYVTLIFLNISIYREIRRSVKIQQAMRCTQSQKEEIKSANVVVGIVLMSILCHIWKIVPDLYEAITKMSPSPTNETFIPIANCSIQAPVNEVPALDIEMIIDTSHLLVGVNSAANFFLYYLLRKNFRSATWRLLTCKGGTANDQHRNTYTNHHQSVRRTQSTNIAMKTFKSGSDTDGVGNRHTFASKSMYNPRCNGGNKAAKATMTELHHLKVPPAPEGSQELLSTTNHSTIAEEPGNVRTAAPDTFDILIKDQDHICIEAEPNKDQGLYAKNAKKKRLKVTIAQHQDVVRS